VSRVLSIALIIPAGVPAVDDVGFHVMAEAEGLSRRGHLVTVLGPSDDREMVDEGRERLAALRDGDRRAVLGEAGRVLMLALGRAVRVSGKLRVGGPLETARGMEAVLRLGELDVAHVHDPLTASPALSVVRRHDGVRAATFHRIDRLAGAALLQPLLARSLSRLDLCIATSEETRAALEELIPREYLVITPARTPPRPELRGGPGPARIAVLARGRDSAGRHFGASLLSALNGERVEATLLVAGALAGRRASRSTEAAIVVDPRPAERTALFERSDLVVFASPEDVRSPALHEAMATGAAIIVPRTTWGARTPRQGVDCLVAGAFSRRSYLAAIDRLLNDAGLRERLGAAAREAAGRHAAADGAAALEAAYLSVIDRPRAGGPSARGAKILRGGDETRNATGNSR
jgi:glycosyltransferase involved in cell wall biosynthesis